VVEGKCAVSTVNANDRKVTIEMAPVELELVENEAISVKVVDEVGAVSTGNRIRGVRNQVRPEHLSAQEQKEMLKICEGYNDVLSPRG
jgi:hypothetical protein